MEFSLSTAIKLCTTAYQLASKQRSNPIGNQANQQELDGSIILLEELTSSLAELDHILHDSGLAYRQQTAPGLSSLCLSLQEFIAIFDPASRYRSSDDSHETHHSAQSLDEDHARFHALGLVVSSIKKELEQLRQWQNTVLTLEIDNLRSLMSKGMTFNTTSDETYEPMDLSSPPHHLLQRHRSHSQLSDIPDLPSPSQPAQNSSATLEALRFPVPSFDTLPIDDPFGNYEPEEFPPIAQAPERLSTPGPIMQLIRSRSNQSLHRRRPDR